MASLSNFTMASPSNPFVMSASPLCLYVVAGPLRFASRWPCREVLHRLHWGAYHELIRELRKHANENPPFRYWMCGSYVWILWSDGLCSSVNVEDCGGSSIVTISTGRTSAHGLWEWTRGNPPLIFLYLPPLLLFLFLGLVTVVNPPLQSAADVQFFGLILLALMGIGSLPFAAFQGYDQRRSQFYQQSLWQLTESLGLREETACKAEKSPGGLHSSQPDGKISTDVDS